MKVHIISHTYSNGNGQINPDRSKRRAELVKAMLTKEFVVEAAGCRQLVKVKASRLIKTHRSKAKQLIEEGEFIKTLTQNYGVNSPRYNLHTFFQVLIVITGRQTTLNRPKFAIRTIIKS